MRIKTQIIATLLSAAALIGLVGGIAIVSEMTLAKSAAVAEATSVGRQLAETIAFKASDAPQSLFERPVALREFVGLQHSRSKRDLVVVDRNKVVLADIPGEEANVGTRFDHDRGNEIGLAIEDGVPRNFVEDSGDVAEPINLVAVPIEDASGVRTGAVLFEYTPLLRAAQIRTNNMLWLVGLCTAAAMLIAAVSTFLLLRGFDAGLSGLTRGIGSLARGDAGARIGRTSNDEFGQLAQGFDTMASELESSRTQLVEQKAYIEDIVQTVAEGIVVVDGNGQIVTVNLAAAQIVGRRSDKIEGQEWRSILDMRTLSGEKFTSGTSPVELALTTGRQHQSEVRLLKPDGSHLPMIASCNPLNRSDGGIVLTLNDISELRRAERAVNDRAEELAVLNRELKVTSEATTRLVKLGELLQACVTFPEAFSVVGSAMPDFFGGLSGTVHLTSASRNLVEEMAHWGAIRSSVGQFAPEDCWALRRGQEHVAGPGMLTPRCNHITENGSRGYVCMPLAAQGETLGIVHLCEPDAADNPDWLVERQQILRGVVDTLALALANLRLRETLRQQSIRDPNTGLYNRRYLEETSSRELRRMERSQQPLAMIMLDVDHFKQFNDTFGHEAGDLVLKQVAGTLLDHARESDVVSRYGGEEFALMMPAVSLADGVERAEGLRKAIKQLHLAHRGRTLGTITASFGVAAFPELGASWAEIVNAADRALYQAKADGRDRVVAGHGKDPADRQQAKSRKSET
ncbi:diguanylate cyclase [Mesorhizobium neociceri]|uniref:diguanylate cyclase n=1 Tax=Mesorhizobium neociceri TaxID=1307853 RepID=A0A838BEU3_9HYPH|nr:diguanylate cyclase [Mesorhizobium neociceri]MBA1145056.1 diguanylate cyclase [Mesorhizobium neociceri]